MRRYFMIVFVGLLLVNGWIIASDSMPQLTEDNASRFAQMALHCIEREFPNKPGHVPNSEKDVKRPRDLHPAFYGCFDWHSSVHGHWMLVKLLKLFPELPEGRRIREAIGGNINPKNIQAETAYFDQPYGKSFERTYGWAWLLKLAEELHGWKDPDGKAWREALRPLEQKIVTLYLDFLPKQTYPIRTGVHANTAFGISFALDYARRVKNKPLEELLVRRSRDYFLQDRDCPGGVGAQWGGFFLPLPDGGGSDVEGTG